MDLYGKSNFGFAIDGWINQFQDRNEFSELIPTKRVAMALIERKLGRFGVTGDIEGLRRECEKAEDEAQKLKKSHKWELYKEEMIGHTYSLINDIGEHGYYQYDRSEIEIKVVDDKTVKYKQIRKYKKNNDIGRVQTETNTYNYSIDSTIFGNGIITINGNIRYKLIIDHLFRVNGLTAFEH